MKNLMVVAALYAAFVVPAYAKTQKERCVNVAETVYYFATERDQGVTSKEMTRRLYVAYNAGSFNDAEYSAVQSLIGMIYSEYRTDSPEKIRHLFLKRCNY